MSRKIAIAQGRMILKGLCLVAVLAGLGSRVLAQEVTQDAQGKQVADRVAQADTQLKARQYKQAAQLYQEILQDSPSGSDQAFQARRKLIGLDITTGQTAKAEQGFKTLVDSFSDRPSFAEAAYEIGEAFRAQSRFAEAGGCYQEILDRCHGSRYEILALKGKAISCVARGQMAEAETAKDQLVSGFSRDNQAAQAVFDVADGFYWFKQYSQAKELYRHVISHHWGTSQAMWSQMGLAIASIAEDDLDGASEATDALVGRYASDANVSEALIYVAGRYEWSKYYRQAGQVYDQIVSRYPGGGHAKEALAGAARVRALAPLAAGKGAGSEAAMGPGLSALLAAFEQAPEMAKDVYAVALEYRQAGFGQRERTLLQRLSEVEPGQKGLDRRRYAALALMGLDRVTEAEGVVNGLIGEFPTDPAMTEAAFEVGQECCDRVCRSWPDSGVPDSGLVSRLQRARAILKRAVEDLPVVQPYTAQAKASWAECSMRLGQYEEARDQFKGLVEDNAGTGQTWHWQYLEGRCYEGLAQSGRMTEAEASQKQRDLYEALVSQYPDSPGARAAGAWLKGN